MLVDDEADLVTVMQKGLENQGSKVMGFSDPVAAIEYFENGGNSIDLVVTDARMPTMSGFQVARRIKEIQPKVKVVLISSFDINRSEFEKVMPHTHIDAFLTKPFHISELMQVIKTFD